RTVLVRTDRTLSPARRFVHRNSATRRPDLRMPDSGKSHVREDLKDYRTSPIQPKSRSRLPCDKRSRQPARSADRNSSGSQPARRRPEETGELLFLLPAWPTRRISSILDDLSGGRFGAGSVESVFS